MTHNGEHLLAVGDFSFQISGHRILGVKMKKEMRMRKMLENVKTVYCQEKYF